MEELAERGVVLECCPTSNVVLGIYPGYEEHPLPRPARRGVEVTLGPTTRRTSARPSAASTRSAGSSFGLDDEELREITETAIEPHSARKRSKSA